MNQYSKLSIEELTDLCESYLQEKIVEYLKRDESDDHENQVSSFIKQSQFKVKDLIITCAENKKYGVLSLSEEFQLGIWEILNPSIYLSTDRQKQLSQEKQQRSKFSVKVKMLEKVVNLINKLKLDKDIAKLEAEYSKYTSLLAKEEE